MKAYNELLRTELQEITDTFVGDRISEQIEKIEVLKLQHPNSIRLLHSAIIGDARSWNFNCHAYSFGLNNCEEYWKNQKS